MANPLWWAYLPTLDAVDHTSQLTRKFNPLRHIPRQCTTAFCEITDHTLQGIADPDPTTAERTSKLWLLLPRLLLAAVADTKGKGKARQSAINKMVKRRLEAFHRGERAALLSTTTLPPTQAQAPTPHPDTTQDPTHTTETQVAAREAVRLTRLGELSRALGRLTSLGVAPPSTATAQKLRDELVGRTPPPRPSRRHRDPMARTDVQSYPYGPRSFAAPP